MPEESWPAMVDWFSQTIHRAVFVTPHLVDSRLRAVTESFSANLRF